MIHIILLILKILGLLLVVLLGLAVSLILIVLLTPLRITLNAGIDNSLESARGDIRFHWLFHLISGKAVWHNGELTWHIRAAWKKFSSEAGSVPEPPAVGKPPEDRQETAVQTPAETGQETDGEAQPEHRRKRDEAAQPEPRQKTADGPEKSEVKQPSRIQMILNRIKSGFQRIKYTFRRLYDKIRSLNRKKERLSAFLSSEIHQQAFARLVREIRRLLRRLRPDRASIDITFGFDDPARTGYTLAGVSLIYPVIGEYTTLTPDFDHKILKGTAFVKEKIRLVYAVIFAWNLFIDKNVRATYRHLRKFKW